MLGLFEIIFFILGVLSTSGDQMIFHLKESNRHMS